MLARARYRTVQVLRQVSARVSAEDWALIATILPPRLLALFERQRAGDQAHAVRVCRALIEQGHREPALLQAALLHDVGKTVGLPLPYRVATVLLRRLAPGALNRLATKGEEHRLLRPFTVSLAHPALGARLAAEAGACPTTVDLIAHHQVARLEGELAPLLRALQSVDDRT